MTWPIEKLGSVCKLVNGDRGKNYPSKDSILSYGIPFINAGNLTDDHSVVCSGANYISEERYDLLSNGKIQCGDILFCLRGSLGKFAVVDSSIPKGAIASSLVIIRPGNKVCENYLKNYLRSTLCAREISRFENGAAQPNLSAKDLREFEIPLPPLAEQKRIASILDKADAIRRKRQQAIQLADDFLRAVFLDMFGDPVTNPKGWEVVMLPDVVFFQEGPGVRNWQFRNSGIKLLNVKNIVDGNLFLGNSDKYLSKDEVCAKYTHFLAEPKDLVMASSGATWGKSAWVDESHLPLCMNTSTIRFHPLDTSILDRHYMHGFFKSSSFRQQIEKMITGSAQPNFGPTHLKQVKIMLPPAKEQSRYANALLSLHEVLINMSEEIPNNLFGSLSQKAFRGEL